MTMGGEFDKQTKANSGVLLINVTALAQHYYGLVRWGRRQPGMCSSCT
jgi:hypothetical protein